MIFVSRCTKKDKIVYNIKFDVHWVFVMAAVGQCQNTHLLCHTLVKTCTLVARVNARV